MNKLKSIFQMKQVVILALLAFMLISSSCTVRNFIQDQLKLPQSSVTNFSKFTILHQANCLNIKEGITLTTNNDSSIEIKQAALFFLTSFFLESNPVEKSFDLIFIDQIKIKSIPFYLLYQNLKLLD